MDKNENIGLSLGGAIGLVIGIFFDQMAFGLPIGAGFGMLIGIVVSNFESNN